mgnify:FL=1
MVIDMDEYLFDKYILTITYSYLFKIGMKISSRAVFSILNKLKLVLLMTIGKLI